MARYPANNAGDREDAKNRADGGNHDCAGREKMSPNRCTLNDHDCNC